LACQTCDANLITIRQSGAGSKPMDGDVTELINGCAVRKFTCLGDGAYINILGKKKSISSIEDGGTGSASCKASCNAARNAWSIGGVVVSAVACGVAVPVCQTCASPLITITQDGEFTKPMDGDVTEIKYGCAVRTFTCQGTNAVLHVS
ncbi:hypothetical protein PMAYCL1PPCAC_21434, partial [Pristionchus mayeri]